MKYLVDAHIFIWLIFNANKINQQQLQVLNNATGNIYISNISFWEIALKYHKGKLNLSGFLPEKLPEVAEKLGLKIIDISAQTMASSHQLSAVKTHKDPFDRMLIWFCIENNYTFVSTDNKLDEYKQQGLKWI